ncbi:hypothetical protein ACLB2K_002427 [Fragaria x ananassa]
MEDMKKKLAELAKANEELTKQIICVTEEKEEEEDRSKPVEEEEYKCREEQPGTEEFFKQVTEPVPLRQRGAQKRKEEEWEYDTPEGLKPTKRTKEVEHKVQNRIVIDGVNCNTDTWKLLDEKVANHYKNWFDLNKDENDEVYLAMLKEEMEKKNVSVGLLGIEAAVKHIMVFIKRVYDSTKYPLSQGLDPEEWRENYDKQDSQGIVVDGYSMMSAEEKRTRRWMLDQNIYQARYKLKDILSCPQQNKTSSDCGPFLLHFIESLCHRKKRQKMAGGYWGSVNFGCSIQENY